MSMLSSKCDRLRNAADELQNVIDNAHNYTWPGIVNTLHYAQQGLRDAADTIWELRNKLADVVDQQDEIERLRSCLSDDAENARQIMGENAKLRELAKAAWGCVKRQVSCDECRMVCCGCTLQSAMRELGIEVDG